MKLKTSKTEPEYKMIKIENLKLDSSNPRIPKSLRDKSDKKIIEYMLLESSTLELMQAIGKNDFFPGEQLLVVHDGDGKYTVIEGNRRLVSVKLLLDNELAPVQKSKVKKVYDEADHRPRKIPCLIFPDKQQIVKYLGYRHTTGIKPWKSLEKARYLYGLKKDLMADKEFDTACRDLAKMIGSRSEFVRRILIGYEIYAFIEDEAFFKIKDLDDTTFYFGYITDSLRHPNIAGFFGIDFSVEKPLKKLKKENVEKWTLWLFKENDQNQTRLKGKSEDLRKLNKVLGNKEALDSFDNGGNSLDKALDLTDDLDTIFELYIKKSYDNLELANEILHKVKVFYPAIDDDLKSIGRLIRAIMSGKDELKDDI